jgi:hypothetical protein
MLTYFLIICSQIEGGVTCLPAQTMPSKKACYFAGDRYVRLGQRMYPHAQSGWKPVLFDCMGLTK